VERGDLARAQPPRTEREDEQSIALLDGGLVEVALVIGRQPRGVAGVDLPAVLPVEPVGGVDRGALAPE